MTPEDLTAEAELVVAVARLIRGLEGAKDWAARSGATGLEQWCSEALSPTGALAVFPPSDTTALAEKTAQIKQASSDLKREAEIVTELADVLEAVRDWDAVTRQDPGGAHKSPMPSVLAALQIVGR